MSSRNAAVAIGMALLIVSASVGVSASPVGNAVAAAGNEFGLWGEDAMGYVWAGTMIGTAVAAGAACGVMSLGAAAAACAGAGYLAGNAIGV